jgi:hypothetical protein
MTDARKEALEEAAKLCERVAAECEADDAEFSADGARICARRIRALLPQKESTK